MNRFDEAMQIMTERFGKDSLISVATVDEGRPYVRTVDAYYADGAFYVVTYTLSNKMRQIARHPEVAVCGDWFTGHGTGENLGHVLKAEHAALMEKIRAAFAAWYTGGHVDEADPNTCLLRIQMTDGLLLKEGVSYPIDFTARTA